MSAATRAAPFYCPYCADEGLRPFDPDDGSAGHGQWRCTACRRVFALRYLGLASAAGPDEAAPQFPDRSETDAQGVRR